MDGSAAREPLPDDGVTRGNELVRKSWAKRARQYDKSMGFFERRLFGSDHREWACSQAQGNTLEVAVGTGLNLPLYSSDVRLTAIDLSPEMLDIARRRAAEHGIEADVRVGDAHRLDFDEASFDTVIATYSLCNIPDPKRAVGEMKRVLRPGGRLILVDHVRSNVRFVYWMQRALELFTIRHEGEHFTRRPLDYVRAEGFEIDRRERMKAGIVERLVAVKPG